MNTHSLVVTILVIVHNIVVIVLVHSLVVTVIVIAHSTVVLVYSLVVIIDEILCSSGSK